MEIYNEDCLIGMSRIADGTIDAIICDLPYGSLSLKWDKVIPLELLWEQYDRIIKPNGIIILFGSEPFSSHIRLSNISHYKYDFVWIKTKAGNFSNCRREPMRYHENIIVFSYGKHTYNLPNLHSIKPIKNGRKNKGSNAKQCANGNPNYMQKESGFNNSVLYFSNKSGKGYSYHPTQKPIGLIEELIKIYTNEGDLILDNCMGSGTTAIACINTKRNFIGFELDKGYFDIAQKRIREHSQQLKIDFEL